MKYMLRTPHVIEGGVRNPGAVVGDDPDCVIRFYGDPTPDMVGLDDASKAKVNEVHERLYGVAAPWHADPNATDPRFRPPAVEEPPLEQDREHFSMSPEERHEAEAESAKALAEANQRHYEQHALAPVALPHPTVGAVGTFVGPATTETPQDQTQRTTVPLKEQLPATGELPQPQPRPQPTRSIPRPEPNKDEK